jgi:hypothetical protein
MNSVLFLRPTPHRTVDGCLAWPPSAGTSLCRCLRPSFCGIHKVFHARYCKGVQSSALMGYTNLQGDTQDG